MMKEILWLSGILVLPLMAYMMLNETRFKKNIVIGVTLPNQAREDQDVQKELADFRKNVLIVNGILLVLAAFGYFSVPESLTMTSWMIWLLLSTAAPYVPYVRTNSRLKHLKEKKGWTQKKETVRVDTSALSGQSWFSPLYFIAPVIIALVPLVFDRSLMFMYITMALLCALFGLSYRYLYRNKAEMVDENTELTKVLTQIRRYAWGKMWLFTSYSMALYSLAGMISMKHFIPGIILTILLTVGLCWYALRLEMKLRRQQEKLTADSGSGWYVDEDDYWLGGVLYNNPNDSRLIINNRIGMNTSINMAKPAGKLLAALLVLLLATLPFMGIYSDYLTSRPIEIAVEDTSLKADLGIIHYDIAVSQIREVKLLEELPEGIRRIAGMGMDHLIQGRFSSDSYESLTVLADPELPPYLLIITEDKNWLLGTRSGEETRAIYEQLIGRTGK